MVVTNGIERAIQYYHAIRDYLKERKSRYQAIVAFSGEHEFAGKKVTEASLNGFPSSQIPDKIQEDPYRFLVCADKFQTGYDEPLLHSMYVDKTLSGIKAVQTLSRLNRAHPKKHDVFVLDFLNDTDTIRDSFATFYRATILADETDPNKLHDLQADLDGARSTPRRRSTTWCSATWRRRARRARPGARCLRGRLQPSAGRGRQQVDFKGKAKGFVRTYGFLSAVLPYTNAEWEKRLDLPQLPDPEAAVTARGRPVQGHPRGHRHGQLPGREAGDARSCWRTRMPRSSRCPSGGGGHKPSPSWTGCPTSSRSSTTTSATSPGRTPTGSGS
jgi:type I restriction enzyme R subunit